MTGQSNPPVALSSGRSAPFVQSNRRDADQHNQVSTGMPSTQVCSFQLPNGVTP